jgi:hypothetical protein
MRTKINNFCENQQVEVSPMKAHDCIPDTVALIQRSNDSSMYFQFTMTPQQAYQLSVALAAAAEEMGLVMV